MGSIFIMHASADNVPMGQITQAVLGAGLQREIQFFDADRSIADAVPDNLVLELAAASDCVILLWSPAMEAAKRSAIAVRAAIQAWSRERLVLGRLQKTELPPGLRDLGAQALKSAGAMESIRQEPVGVEPGSSPSAPIQEVDLLALVNLVEARIKGGDAVPGRVAPEPMGPPEVRAQARASGAGGWMLGGLAVVLLAAAGAGVAYMTWPGPPGGKFDMSSSAPDTKPSQPGSHDNSELICPWWDSGCKPARPDFGETGKNGTEAPAEEAKRWYSSSFWSPWLVKIGLAAGSVILVLGGVLWSRARRARQTREVVRINYKLKRLGSEARAEEASAATGPGHHVFVSYSQRDAEKVKQVVKQIEAAGYRVWIDSNISGAAQRYAAQIVKAIRGSKVVALMGSQNSFGSDHVVREVYVAGDLKKAFVVVQLDDADIPDELLYFITGFPRVKASESAPDRMRSEIARYVAA